MRKNSIKNTRINGEVLRELSNIIRGEIKDPRINPMTSVVAVEVAPDLKTAKAYIKDLLDPDLFETKNPRWNVCTKFDEKNFRIPLKKTIFEVNQGLNNFQVIPLKEKGFPSSYMSVFTRVPHCLDHCITYFKIRTPDASRFVLLS